MRNLHLLLRWLWRHRLRMILGLAALGIVDAIQMAIPFLTRAAIDDLGDGRTDRRGAGEPPVLEGPLFRRLRLRRSAAVLALLVGRWRLVLVFRHWTSLA